MEITHEDANLLQNIAIKLGENITTNDEHPNAVESLRQNLSFREMAKLTKAKITAEFNQNSKDPVKRAQSNVALCALVLPALERTFGQEFLVAALPEEAKSDHVVALCEELGQKDLANLCRKAMKPSP